MHIEYTGRNTIISPRLKLQAEAELTRIAPIIGKVLGAHVTLKQDGYRHLAEITIRTGYGDLVATCEKGCMADALHDALRRIGRQAVRHRQRRTTLTRHPGDITALPQLHSNL